MTLQHSADIFLPMVEKATKGSSQEQLKYHDFGKRLRIQMDALGLSIRDICKALGITHEMGRRYTLGMALPRPEKMAALADLCKTTAAYLTYGLREDRTEPVQGDDIAPYLPPLAVQAEARNRGPANSNVAHDSEAIRIGVLGASEENHLDISIPQYKDVGGAMGHGVELRDQPGEFHALHVSPDWIDKNIKNYTAKSNLAVVTGFGDSMKGMFNPGDPLIVDRGVTIVDYDAVYFFRVANEGFIKRLQRVPGRGLIAISENKAYLDWVILPEMDFEIFARVIKVWKSEDL
jgi:phage repressor protein C with HTH and peptisase S24 domain